MNNVKTDPCGYRGLRLTALMLWMAAASAFTAQAAAGGEDVPVVEADHGSRVHLQLQQQFIREFSDFAGSLDNAQNLYRGLRKGSRIMLTRQTVNSNGMAGTAVLQFNPAGLPMASSSAFVSAALARQQLANQGIRRPLPQQIQAALNGGMIKPVDPRAPPIVLKGVLVQRSEGLGWGHIAKASGISLGRLIRDMRYPAVDAVALAGDRTYVQPPRGSRHATLVEAPAAMRTSAGMLARNDGLIAQ